MALPVILSALTAALSGAGAASAGAGAVGASGASSVALPDIIAKLQAGLPEVLKAQSQDAFMAKTDNALSQYLGQDANAAFDPTAPVDVGGVTKTVNLDVQKQNQIQAQGRADAAKGASDALGARNKFKSAAPQVQLGSRFGGFRR